MLNCDSLEILNEIPCLSLEHLKVFLENHTLHFRSATWLSVIVGEDETVTFLVDIRKPCCRVY